MQWTNLGASANASYVTVMQPTITANAWKSATITATVCTASYPGTLLTAVGSADHSPIPAAATQQVYLDVEVPINTSATNGFAKTLALGSGLTQQKGSTAGEDYPIIPGATASKPTTATI
jgi:hypothetical protein